MTIKDMERLTVAAARSMLREGGAFKVVMNEYMCNVKGWIAHG